MWKYVIYVLIAVFISSALLYSTPKKEKKETYVNDPNTSPSSDKMQDYVKDLAYKVNEIQQLVEHIQTQLANNSKKKESYQDKAPETNEVESAGSVEADSAVKEAPTARENKENRDDEEEDEEEEEKKAVAPVKSVSSPSNEGFANFTGVQSRQFDNFMLL
jgi:septal ring factor EnvC (AmiA/AmiB activator)